ncbi:MAG: helix-turn-helix domain-containing protein [Deltaproteobacteria bacterium]|jgi:cytoskeleton protein RodZ|nr:helix-turn-helix domain-containing protein [Deltaproteobacteria bacterium]
MNFEELGVLLQQERERRGLSVEEVANRLKLMPRVVRAIEQADMGELPQAAYARGFVKAYGLLLALDEEALYSGLEDAWPEDSHPLPVPYEPAWEKKRGGDGRMAALVVLMLILAAAGWFWLSRDLDGFLPSGLRLQGESASPARSASQSPLARSRSASPAPASAPAAVAPPAAPSQPAAPAVPAESLRPESAPIAPLSAELPVPAAPSPDQRNLVITALAECWVKSTADSSSSREFTLRKGDTFALTFNKKIVLTFGNAGGVKLRLDGQDLDPPGEVGQVKTLTLPTTP